MFQIFDDAVLIFDQFFVAGLHLVHTFIEIIVLIVSGLMELADGDLDIFFFLIESSSFLFFFFLNQLLLGCLDQFNLVGDFLFTLPVGFHMGSVFLFISRCLVIDL